MPRQSPDALRFSLSHFAAGRASWKPTGPKSAPTSSCGDVPFVNGIRSLAMDAAASRRTMRITTGSRSAVAAALIAGKRSPSFRPSRSPTRTTASWLAVRPCGGASRSTAPGKKQHLRLKTPIACPIPPRSAAGLAAWIPPSGGFLPAPHTGPRRPLADAPRSDEFPSSVLADSCSAGSLAPPSLRIFPCTYHPCLGMRLGFSYARLWRRKHGHG